MAGIARPALTLSTAASRLAKHCTFMFPGEQRRGHTEAPRFIYRTLTDVQREGKEVSSHTKTWTSRRYLTREDGFGFSFHETVLKAGTSTLIHYKNHVEAVLICSGSGWIELANENNRQDDGFAKFRLEPGTFYGLGGQERHFLYADPEQDMVVACAFNPPIAGIEDHNASGVYPAIGDDGVRRYHYGNEAVPCLFKPPESLKDGSANGRMPPDSRVFQTRVGEVLIRKPRGDEGKDIAELAQHCGLDYNSPYCYMLYCKDFADTCAVAVKDHKVVGYIHGHRPPHRPEALFVWQVGVAEECRGSSIASLMIAHICWNTGCTFLEASVTPSNHASQALFLGICDQLACPVQKTPNWMPASEFPGGHEAEDFYRIGPFFGEALAIWLDSYAVADEHSCNRKKCEGPI